MVFTLPTPGASSSVARSYTCLASQIEKANARRKKLAHLEAPKPSMFHPNSSKSSPASSK